MSTIPHSVTGAFGATNLWSTATHQFAVWYTLAGELRIGRIERGVQRFGVDHDEYEFTGALRTALALPVPDDEHNFASVAVDGLGRVHVWANMHNDPMQALRSVDAHTNDGWLATGGWAVAGTEFTGVESRVTYPTPVMCRDNSLWFYSRDGVGTSQSGRGNSYFWTRAANATTWSSRVHLFQGLEVPDAGGTGIPGSDDTVDDITNWNSYPSIPVVETSRHPYPGRMHMSWVWRQWALEPIGGGPGAETNILASYAYSDDHGHSWKAVDGTALTLPIHPLNNYACQIPGSALIRSIARASNVVTAELHRPCSDVGIAVGNSVTVRNATASFEGVFTVTAVGSPNPTSISWAQTGSNESGGLGSVTRYTYVNWGSIALDTRGFPQILGSTGPNLHIRRDDTNTGWLTSNVANPIAGILHMGYLAGIWHRGRLWGLSVADPGFSRRLRLFALQGTAQYVTLSGDVGRDYDATFDPEALRLHDSVEVLAPDGDVPRVFTFGRGARAIAA